jgi:hypothetical protein
MNPGSTILLHLPPSAGVERRNATAVESNADGFIVSISADAAINAPVGSTLVAYYHDRNRFMKQPGEVMAVRLADGQQVIACKWTGENASAELRQTFRVRVGHMGMIAKVDAEKKCAVLDVSASGLAIIAKASYKVGELVRITFTHEGRELIGMARIQGRRQAEEGAYRYGLHIPEKKSEMRSVLERLSANIQRAQIKASRESA